METQQTFSYNSEASRFDSLLLGIFDGMFA